MATPGTFLPGVDPTKSRWGRCGRAFLRTGVAPFLAVALAAAVSGAESDFEPSPELEARIASLFSALPPVQLHYEGPTAEAVARQERRAENYLALLREKARGQWIAALLSTQPEREFVIEGRFQTWGGFQEFLTERQVLIEVWTFGEGGRPGRRVSATELAEFKRMDREPPTFITVTYRAAASAEVRTNRVEFGFAAADEVLAAHQGYLRHRTLQRRAQEILAARDSSGGFSAVAQWEALKKSIEAGEVEIEEPPARPDSATNLFVAFEYAVDEQNHIARIVRAWREDEVHPQVVLETGDRGVQVLMLTRAGEKTSRQARGFRPRGLGDELEPLPAPLLGQDPVELRVADASEPDPRKWHLIEFGEPELVRESALAKFSLLNAHFDKRRKEIAVRKSNYDLIAEPIIAGLNIGGGLAGVPFPIGDAARLGYNAAIVPWLIPEVPSTKQMRELFRLMAAKDKDPQLKTKPGEFLNEADFKKLQESAKPLTDAEVAEYLQRVGEEDLKAMRRLAQMQHIDARVSNLLSIMADAGKVSGWTEEPGWPRDIFNSIYFSVTGDISIKNIVAVLVGGEVATPRNGWSLEQLSHGEGPAAAWLQYLNFTVDIRAVVNTIARLMRPTLADKELKKPFPYAPRMSDLSAYEIRIFGFPLLMFHKRGLIKDDSAAFTNDFAYGLLGARIIEHFPTREDMDREIRAGAMAPLGFVRVPDGKGGWKESHLAVFAHRIREGSHKGKTTIVIYGLKAYEDHSRLIEREGRRFKQFEQGMIEGAVIERLVEAEDAGSLRAPDFEPTLRTGPEALAETYLLLSRLQELNRLLKRRAWGLVFTPEEQAEVVRLREALADRGVGASDEAPLLGVDRFHSTFRYRQFVGGRARVVQVTTLASMEDVRRDLAKAQAGAQLETERRNVLTGGAPVSDPAWQGIVFLHEAVERDGRPEVGPLWNGEANPAVGGIPTNRLAVAAHREWIERLPVTARARLTRNHFAATLVDLAPVGIPRKLFVTIEAPIDREVGIEVTNRLTGEVERHVTRDGRLLRIVTDRRILEAEHDNGRETATRLFVNRGSRQQPVAGGLVEETRTVARWFGDPQVADPNPYAPVVAKLRVNHVTGEMARDVFGAFPLPVESDDELYVTRNQFTPQGDFTAAAVLDNGRTDAELARSLADKLLAPVEGVQRFTLAIRVPPVAIAQRLGASPYLTFADKNDVLKKTSRTVAFDRRQFGRLAGESYEEAGDTNVRFVSEVIAEYDERFALGLVANRTLKTCNGAPLAETRTARFDPAARRVIGVETDYTGKSVTNTWDYRWESPVLIETGARRTTNQFNRAETEFTATTVARSSGETVSTSTGRYDDVRGVWRVERSVWHRPGVLARAETNTLSAYGRWLETRVGNLFETRTIYGAQGRLQQVTTFRSSSVNSPFDVPHRQEDAFEWHGGSRQVRVRTFTEGLTNDLFRIMSDSEGRLVVDGIRREAGVDLRTVITYDGDSERLTKSETFQNGALRTTRLVQAEQAQADGRVLLPVVTVPAWGLIVTQMFVLGDPLAHPVETVSESGERVQVTAWFPDSAVAVDSVAIDRHGRVRERVVLGSASAALGGAALDSRSTFRVDAWGQSAFAGRTMLLRGTDVAVYRDAADERVYFDLSQPFEAPHFAVDPSGSRGVPVTLDGVKRTNVLAVFKTRVLPPVEGREPLLEVQSVDLRGLFSHQGSRQLLDRTGQTLEERLGTIPNSGVAYADTNLWTALAGMKTTRIFRHSYAKGWLVEQPDPVGGGRRRIFTTNDPPPGVVGVAVNEGPWREWRTEVQGWRLPDEGMADAGGRLLRPFRREHSPHERESNPFLPARSGVWTTWISTELGTNREPLFSAEVMHDAEGRRVATKVEKHTSNGARAVKMFYVIPPLAESLFISHPLKPGTNMVPLNLGGSSDASSADFLYFHREQATSGGLTVVITDAQGRMLQVKENSADTFDAQVARIGTTRKDPDLFTVLLGAAESRWLPGAAAPVRACGVSASPGLVGRRGAVALSVHELARQGLEVGQIKTVQAVISSATNDSVALSPIYLLQSGEPFIADANPVVWSEPEQTHASSITTYAKDLDGRRWRHAYVGHGRSAVMAFNGRPFGVASVRAPYLGSDRLVMLDNADPDGPRPIYALSPDDGRLIERYRMVREGGAQLFSIAHGFGVPRLEVFRAEVLDDETGPAFLAYGHEHPVSLPMKRGNAAWSAWLADVENRIAANGFRFGAERLLPVLPAARDNADLLERFHVNTSDDAAAQAEQVNRLPMLAQVLLSSHDVPWIAGAPAVAQAPWPIDTNQVRLVLLELAVVYPSTGLVPTSPGGDAERFVDSVKEAELILLAVRLKLHSLARDLLRFYQEKSHNGADALHDSYDAQSGDALSAALNFERPPHSRRTAAAQLALAEAAFTLGLETADTNALGFGKNLVARVLEDFRRPSAEAGGPRGIAEERALARGQFNGFTLWPDGQRYRLASNARAFVLLKRLEVLTRQLGNDDDWRTQITSALNEQRAWFARHILPAVEAGGVVPAGVFELQDLPRATNALALERWTSAEDWLAFVEAAHEMGVPAAAAQRWLENLARVHGVRVGAIWGLDWSVALMRPDAISVDLTARFWRVARLIGHEDAAAFAGQQLLAMARFGEFPSIITEASPALALKTGQGFDLYPHANHLGWPRSWVAHKELLEAGLGTDNLIKAGIPAIQGQFLRPRTDRTLFLILTGLFYSSIIVSMLFWWLYRRRRSATLPGIKPLVSEAVMQRAEERWAKRVLGMTTPPGAKHTRYSNAPLEQNFLMQLRAIYKLVLEWRRRENGWTEDDPRLAGSGSDAWLNGLDELACLTGLYMRQVIKAGAKDGFRQPDPLDENEDSNHIWSRLVMYYSEFYRALLGVVDKYQKAETTGERSGHSRVMVRLLATMNVRQREEAFDARTLFNAPTDPNAFDLLLVQRPGMTLRRLWREAEEKLRVPFDHLERMVADYQKFKRREQPYPIHPYVIEAAKVMPHFLIMGLGALVWYNQSQGNSPIVPYLKTLFTQMALSPESLFWAVPLLAGVLLSVWAALARKYRWEGRMAAAPTAGPSLDDSVTVLFRRGEGGAVTAQPEAPSPDESVTALFRAPQSPLPAMKEGRAWDDRLYLYPGWVLRAIGCFGLGLTLLRIDTPSLAAFLAVKGIIAVIAFAEMAAVVLPLAGALFSKAMQDWTNRRPRSSRLVHVINRLNITATRPASPMWLAIRYHTAPALPTGSFLGRVQAFVFYFGMAAGFFFSGAFVGKEILSLWFTDTYLVAADWKLALGSLVFWNTMYLLRYAIFVLASGLAAALVTFPLQTVFATLAAGHLALGVFGNWLGIDVTRYSTASWALLGVGAAVMLAEPQLRAWLKRAFAASEAKRAQRTALKLETIKRDRNVNLGIVFMGGDALSGLALDAELLMGRWRTLREHLGSIAAPESCRMTAVPDDVALEVLFRELHGAELQAGVTLWHPAQLHLTGEPARLAGSGLTIAVPDDADRERLVTAWHLRRWLVTMMSGAGESQDTAVNLIDMALRLRQEGLAANTVFYLIQNKYDDRDNNRPSQCDYTRGELGQREKLARLLGELAGIRAYSVQNWTPFAFKAGGMTGLDLVPEETLRLSTMLVLDRNATVHDLDAFMEDVAEALTDPDLVAIIPGRGTTNTLTPIGHGSQMVEEGHRAFLKGLMSLLGGTASENIGTGWGNLISVQYRSVQRALLDPLTAKAPLTSRMLRGSTLAARTSGLIGFTPNAVGISEDTWAVSQATHNAQALGRRVRFRLSRALWHKRRETWSHAEWLASFPRWAGGYLQMMHDPIMQRINDLGPASVFSKEIRANSGRFFLSAPFVLLNVLLMPLAILLDVTPFVQILIVLWNLGFIMNQVLTLHGLNALLESTGFNRATALAGGLIAGLAALWFPGWHSSAPGLALLGFVLSGFMTGLGRWLGTRVRDVVIFGPQLVLHTLGQVFRQSLEFTVSGAAPQDARGVNMAYRAWAGSREDRPFDRYPAFMNLKTIVWRVGLFALATNLFALSRLDILNALLLLPTLIFTASVLIGPFIYTPKPGRHLSGPLRVAAQALGWIASLLYFSVVSVLIAGDGWAQRIGVALALVVPAVLFGFGLRYFGFDFRLRRATRRLRDLLGHLGLPQAVGLASGTPSRPDTLRLAEALVRLWAEPAALRTALAKVGASTEQQEAVAAFVQDRVSPILRAPASALLSSATAGRRFLSEFNCALVLSLLVFVWFMLVPVPGLFVFTAGAYKISVGFGELGRVVGWIVIGVIGAYFLGRLADRFELRGCGLSVRMMAAWRRFIELNRRSGLSTAQSSSLHAAFTDVQTYMDQRAHAYAYDTLDRAEAELRCAEKSQSGSA